VKNIQKYVDDIKEEIESAKEYAEKYIELKAKGNVAFASKYREMAEDELKHANYLHSFAIEEIEKISKVYTPPVDMQEKWEHEHKKYIENVAWIKQILSM
jgi:hypothetical protein